ncbi:beta-galactosidase [Candidatus Omnitrophota bacterium]
MNGILKTIKVLLAALLIFQGPALGAKEVRIGTTYSPHQSGYLGMDWKKTYLAVLDEGFDIVRLGAYWSEIEKEKDIYDFSSLDWQIKEAKKRGIPVVLTVGMKVPRWPEFFIPEWIEKDIRTPRGGEVSRNEVLQTRTLRFIAETVVRYMEEDAIGYWQVENEPLNRFGEKNWRIDRDFLGKEVDLVRKLDRRKRPIMLTAATYPNVFLRGLITLSLGYDPVKEIINMSDIVGLNVYPHIGYKLWGRNLYFKTGHTERDKYFRRLFDEIKKNGRDVWIAELQAEPWEPGHLAYKEKAEPITASPEETESFLEEFEELGASTILLWGAEYWVYRMKVHGDKKWIDIMREARGLKIKK